MLGLWGKGGFKKYWGEVISLYDDLYFTYKTKNLSYNSRKLPSTKGKIGVDFAATHDGDKIVFYYLISELPRELSIDFKAGLRRDCKEGVKVNFYNYIRRHNIEWNSTQMTSRLRTLKRVGSDNNKEGVDAYSMHNRIGALSKQSWIEDSLTYLSVADLKRGRSLLKSSILMTVSGTKGMDFDVSVATLERYAENRGIKLQRVLYNIPEIVRFFSPFSRELSDKVKRSLPTQVITDEIMARYNVYTQGTLGNRGIIFGVDVHSGFPVLKVVKPREDTAENWLVTAETGGGKSNTIKEKIIQLLAMGYNGTVMDIEGFEYIPLANFVSNNSKVIIINMAEGSGSYFDPVEISDMSGIPEIDSEAKNMSSNFTIALFKTLLGESNANNDMMDTAINDALSALYLEQNITTEPETWINSKGLTIFDVYRHLKQNLDTKYRDIPDYLESLGKAIAILGRYFEEGGIRNSMFSDRVLVSDIIDADLVICSFGMAGKSPQSVDKIQLALMQISAAQLSHQRSIFSKAQGKYNFKVWEEFQRWGNFPDADKTIGVAVTGGRKLGDVNIIITNDVGIILKDDRFGIFSNITSYLIGAISDRKVRHDLCDRLTIPHMKDELDTISKAKRDDSDELDKFSTQLNKFTYSFLCGLDRSKFGIIRTELPPDIAKSKIFKTGVDLGGTVK